VASYDELFGAEIHDAGHEADPLRDYRLSDQEALIVALTNCG
jgi:hypothetical protein